MNTRDGLFPYSQVARRNRVAFNTTSESEPAGYRVAGSVLKVLCNMFGGE